MNRNAFKQRQIFQRQTTGDVTLKPISERRLIAVISASPQPRLRPARHGCGDKPPAQCLLAPLLRLFPGPVAGQFDLHVPLNSFATSSAPLAVLISAQQLRSPSQRWLRSTCEKGFCPLGNFGVCQHNFVRVQRFQVTTARTPSPTQRMVPTSIMSTSRQSGEWFRRRYP